MLNFSPARSPEFLARQQPKYGDRALAKPIPVRFPQNIDAILRDKTQTPDLQALVRSAVELYLMPDYKSQLGGLGSESVTPPVTPPVNTPPDPQQLQAAIDRVLLSLPPRDRAAANKLFKKLLAQFGD